MRLIHELDRFRDKSTWTVELTPLELEQITNGETVEEPIMGDERTFGDFVLKVQVKGEPKT